MIQTIWPHVNVGSVRFSPGQFGASLFKIKTCSGGPVLLNHLIIDKLKSRTHLFEAETHPKPIQTSAYKDKSISSPSLWPRARYESRHSLTHNKDMTHLNEREAPLTLGWRVHHALAWPLIQEQTRKLGLDFPLESRCIRARLEGAEVTVRNYAWAYSGFPPVGSLRDCVTLSEFPLRVEGGKTASKRLCRESSWAECHLKGTEEELNTDNQRWAICLPDTNTQNTPCWIIITPTASP